MPGGVVAAASVRRVDRVFEREFESSSSRSLRSGWSGGTGLSFQARYQAFVGVVSCQHHSNRRGYCFYKVFSEFEFFDSFVDAVCFLRVGQSEVNQLDLEGFQFAYFGFVFESSVVQFKRSGGVAGFAFQFGNAFFEGLDLSIGCALVVAFLLIG